MGNLISNIWTRFAGYKDMRILMVGLDAAGKTTILYKLKLGDVVHSIPTIGFNVEEITYKNISFHVWDVGGQTQIRRFWDQYFNNTDAIIFVVDSADRGRIDEAKEELHKLMNDESLKDAAFLVYANKQDMAGAMSTSEIWDKLDLASARGKQVYCQSAIATRGDGLYEGLDWLSNTLTYKNKS